VVRRLAADVLIPVLCLLLVGVGFYLMIAPYLGGIAW